MGPFPLARSASPAAIINHLLSQPPPSLEHSREVILEYVLAREGKLREKKPGRGGKGTLGRDGFEDISKRLGEVEDGLRGASTTLNDPAGHRRSKSQPSIDQDLEDPHKIGLALVLSLRMSLSYFSPQELANQLLLLAIGDAERVIVQHIRRRVQGEGRWGVGKELECVEALVSKPSSARLELNPSDLAPPTSSAPRFSLRESPHLLAGESRLSCHAARARQIGLHQAFGFLREGSICRSGYSS